MSLKKNVRDHSARKNQGSAEFFRKQRKQRNSERPKQITIIERDAEGNEKITGPFRAGESYGEPR